MYEELNATYLSRPARKQKEFIDPKKYHVEGANEYNIWYGRFLGENDKNDRVAATDRCVVEKDAGFTKADKTSGEGNKKNRKYFCIHFAHGTLNIKTIEFLRIFCLFLIFVTVHSPWSAYPSRHVRKSV
jgi:hypothetical protein